MDGKQYHTCPDDMNCRFLTVSVSTQPCRLKKTICLLSVLTVCLFFLPACKPTAEPDTSHLKAEIAQEFARADQGNAAARFNIGLMYFKGEGVPQDYGQARVWFEKAAAQGLGEAQYNLGAMLEQGLGTEKNAAKAKSWYEKAAGQGIGQAQYSLAKLYLTGKGTSQNLDKASEWLQKAAEQGMTQARERFSILVDSRSGSFETAKIQSWLQQSVQGGGEKVKLLQEKIRY